MLPLDPTNSPSSRQVQQKPCIPENFLALSVYQSLSGNAENPIALKLLEKYADRLLLWSMGENPVRRIPPSEIADQIISCEIYELLGKYSFYYGGQKQESSNPESAFCRMLYQNYNNNQTVIVDLTRTSDHKRKVVIDLEEDNPDFIRDLKSLNLPVEIFCTVQNVTVKEDKPRYDPDQATLGNISESTFRTLRKLANIPEPLSSAEHEMLIALWEKYIQNGALYHGTSSAFADSIRRHGLDPNYSPYKVEELNKLNAIYERVNGYKVMFFTPDHYSQIGLTHSREHAMNFYASNIPEKIAVMLCKATELLDIKQAQLNEQEKEYLRTLVIKYTDYKNPSPIVVKVKLLPCLLKAVNIKISEDFDCSVDTNDPIYHFLNPENFAEFVKNSRHKNPELCEDFESKVKSILKAFISQFTDLRIPLVRCEDILDIS